MRLFIVRHAEAAQGQPDDRRPLTPAGRTQAREVGRRLAAQGVHPPVVLSSPLLRAVETAEEIARALGARVEADERLAPGVTPAEIRNVVLGLDGPVVLVGHQPDCGRAAAAFGDGEERPFPPAGVAAVEL